MKTKLYPFKGKYPKLGEGVFIAPGARIIGDVEIGDQSSVWFNCVVRGDVEIIRIGARTNIQDGTIVHVTGGQYGTFIGDDVLIGHMAIIHGCTLESRSFVGMGATVMDGCVIESGGMLAAGGLLTPGKRIAKGEMWAGRPARLARQISDDEMKQYLVGVGHYKELAAIYGAEYEKL
ncbi:MAG: gamma carbonic anhydrase family protein [Sphingomonadales bacterium]|nr:gamma carbonic anhydrase family protein [Sphingomonadales bacterium]